MKSTLMRRLSILLVLAMVLAMLPVGAMAETPTTLYLSPNSNWNIDSARFAAYFFNASGNTWVDMTDADADGVYEVAVPEGYTSVIFCRMDPSTTKNNWTNKWNQTGNIALADIPEGMNLCSINAGQWDCGSNYTWSAYTAGDIVTEATSAPLNYSYYVIGSMNSWTLADDALGMTDEDGDGIYSVTVALEAGAYTYLINDGTWNQKWSNNGADFSLELTEACDVTFTLNPTTGEVTATGAGEGEIAVNSANVKGTIPGMDWDETADTGAMTLVDGIYTLTIDGIPASEVGADPYAFKVVTNNSWSSAYPAEDWTFYMSAEGSVTITYNPETDEITLTGDYVTYDAPTEGGDTPVDPVEDTWHVKGDVAGLDWDLTTGTGAMTKNDDGSYSLTIADVAAAGKYSVKAVKNSAWEGAAGGMGAGGNYEFSVSAPCAVTFTVSAEGALSVTGDNVGEPVATELVIESVVIAGNGDGTDSGSGWLNGVQWNPASSVNKLYLEEGSDSVYTITYYNIAAGTYEFKFAINGSWDISYASGDVVVSGETYTAWHSPLGNSSFTVEKDGSTVTFVLDMTGVVYATDDASMSITIEAPADAGESSAPETLVIGENNFVIATGDGNIVSSTFTATADGTLYIKPVAMTVINWLGEVEEVPAEYIGMQFGRAYTIWVDGVQFYGETLDVVAGQTYEIGFSDNNRAGAWITLLLCDNHNVTYSFADGYHTVGCSACGMGTSVEGTSEFKFRTCSLSLGSDISVVYKASVDSCFNNVYVTFTVTDASGEVFESVASDYTIDESNGRYVFVYEGINPQLMGDTIVATLTGSINGMEVTFSYEYSVISYCQKQLDKASNTAEFKTLLSDMLVYGAKAQILQSYNTDKLVTDLVTGLTPSTFPGSDELIKGQVVGNTDLKNDIADVKTASLALSNKVGIKFGMALDDASLYTYQITVNGETTEYTEWDLAYNEDNGRYYLEVGVLATEFDTPVTLIILKDGNQVSRSLTYTANTYIKANCDKGDAMADVLQALYNYGKSSEEYKNSL